MRRRRRGLVNFVTYIMTYTQIQYSMKTENPLPAAPFGGGGLGSIMKLFTFGTNIEPQIFGDC